jgi:hypothetical protein
VGLFCNLFLLKSVLWLRQMFRKFFSNIALLLLLGLYYNSVPIAWLSYATFAEKIFAEHCVNPTKPSCNGKCQVMEMESKAKSGDHQAPSVKLPQFHPPLPVSNISKNITRVANKITFISETPRIHSGILQAPFHPPKSV